jgi:5-methylcytosine-specific restriction endonuclease McrA
MIEVKHCLRCEKSLSDSDSLYCSRQCSWDSQVLDHWFKTGEIKGSAVRDYLIAESNGACSECGWAMVNKSTGQVPLQIDHIDGDRTNNWKDNLRVLCPNCHSLTPTFGALNRKTDNELMRVYDSGGKMTASEGRRVTRILTQLEAEWNNHAKH